MVHKIPIGKVNENIMGREIERKYLVIDCRFKDIAVEKKHIVQGYLSTSPDSTVRIRTINDEQGFITVKSRNKGATRGEWEYEIPYTDAVELLALCQKDNLIDKSRYVVEHDSKTWEIDEFMHPCSGLIVAEIELADENEQFTLPDFIGQEVTGDARYYNSNLSSNTRMD